MQNPAPLDRKMGTKRVTLWPALGVTRDSSLQCFLRTFLQRNIKFGRYTCFSQSNVAHPARIVHGGFNFRRGRIVGTQFAARLTGERGAVKAGTYEIAPH